MSGRSGARRPWNHNLHYHRIILDSLPPRPARVLDVGCGEGSLVRELSARCGQVTGIDSDQPSIELAREHTSEQNADFVLADFLTESLGEGTFDGVVSVATIHHMQLELALARMRDLTAPGGTVVIVGLARSSRPIDYLTDAAAVVASWVHRARRGYWEHPSPKVWPPPTTYRDVMRIAPQVLPGAVYRRLLLFRYSLLWHKPAIA